jgi:hypothetical protein
VSPRFLQKTGGRVRIPLRVRRELQCRHCPLYARVKEVCPHNIKKRGWISFISRPQWTMTTQELRVESSWFLQPVSSLSIARAKDNGDTGPERGRVVYY